MAYASGGRPLKAALCTQAICKRGEGGEEGRKEGAGLLSHRSIPRQSCGPPQSAGQGGKV